MILLFFLLLKASSSLEVAVTTPKSQLVIREISSMTIQLDRLATEDIIFNCLPSSQKRIEIKGGNNITVLNGTNSTTVDITAGLKGGTVYFYTEIVQPEGTNISITDLEMSVVHSASLQTFITVLGWFCFAMWSMSFYPQAYKNWKRKSVVGLSFDFLGYNLLGWLCYTAFNFSLLWVEPVRQQYFEVFPHGVINVQLSDFCFSAHAFVLTFLTIVQCFFYERGDQTPSFLCKAIMGVFVSGMVIMLIVTASSCVTWFQYVSIFSYVKLAVTLFKYSPQVYVNFKKKSTEAVAISVYLLDMGGGLTSLIQMGLIAYNYDDWKTFIGDFTKFGLAVLSIVYDLIFIFQHYCLYKHSEETAADEDEEPLLSDNDS